MAMLQNHITPLLWLWFSCLGFQQTNTVTNHSDTLYISHSDSLSQPFLTPETCLIVPFDILCSLSVKHSKFLIDFFKCYFYFLSPMRTCSLWGCYLLYSILKWFSSMHLNIYICLGPRQKSGLREEWAEYRSFLFFLSFYTFLYNYPNEFLYYQFSTVLHHCNYHLISKAHPLHCHYRISICS
jgi:hypothetical protein